MCHTLPAANRASVWIDGQHTFIYDTLRTGNMNVQDQDAGSPEQASKKITYT